MPTNWVNTEAKEKAWNRLMRPENVTSKIVDCIVDEAEGSVTFQFKTNATELLGDKDPRR